MVYLNSKCLIFLSLLNIRRLSTIDSQEIGFESSRAQKVCNPIVHDVESTHQAVFVHNWDASATTNEMTFT